MLTRFVGHYCGVLADFDLLLISPAFCIQLELNTVDDSKGTQASTLYATACRHFHQAATILSALTGHSNDENVTITAKHYLQYLFQNSSIQLIPRFVWNNLSFVFKDYCFRIFLSWIFIGRERCEDLKMKDSFEVITFCDLSVCQILLRRFSWDSWESRKFLLRFFWKLWKVSGFLITLQQSYWESLKFLGILPILERIP